MEAEQALPKSSRPAFTSPIANMSREYLIAGFVSLLWVSALLTYGAGYFGLFEGRENRHEAEFLDVILYMTALVLPVMFLWLGAYLIHQTRRIFNETAALRDMIANQGRGSGNAASQTEIAKTISEATTAAMRAEQSRMTTHFKTLDTQQGRMEAALRTLLKSRGQEQQAISQLVETAQDIAQKAARKANATDGRTTRLSQMTFEAVNQSEDQDDLPLDTPAPAKSEAIEWKDLIRALNFPEDEHDSDGFSAIRRVLPNRKAAQLLQASEDVLSMLAQEGIYMDDLNADEANPDLWHKFARGSRGEEIAEMGTIIDQAALALARGRTRSDNVFRDGALHFLRLFDQFLQEFLDQATDREIKELAQTRTGRAFQLLARVSGTFD